MKFKKISKNGMEVIPETFIDIVICTLPLKWMWGIIDLFWGNKIKEVER